MVGVKISTFTIGLYSTISPQGMIRLSLEKSSFEFFNIIGRLLPDDNHKEAIWSRTSYSKVRPERSQVLCHSRAAVNFFCIFSPSLLSAPRNYPEPKSDFFIWIMSACASKHHEKYLWKTPYLPQTTREIGVVRGPE